MPRFLASWTTNFTWSMCSGVRYIGTPFPGDILNTKMPLAASRSRSWTILAILSLASPPFQLRNGWMEWGEAAFARAVKEDKPILLDIGAVWCHWCHVMDRESYEDDATAQIINEHFVAVKVDRDERPDVDTRYQAAVSAISGQGGWPLTAFLTPEGKPYFGGTYFPPEDRHGRPSFQRVLLTMADAFLDRRA